MRSCDCAECSRRKLTSSSSAICIFLYKRNLVLSSLFSQYRFFLFRMKCWLRSSSLSATESYDRPSLRAPSLRRDRRRQRARGMYQSALDALRGFRLRSLFHYAKKLINDHAGQSLKYPDVNWTPTSAYLPEILQYVSFCLRSSYRHRFLPCSTRFPVQRTNRQQPGLANLAPYSLTLVRCCATQPKPHFLTFVADMRRNRRCGIPAPSCEHPKFSIWASWCE